MNRRTFLKTTIMGLTGLTIGCNWGCCPPEDENYSDVTIWINISEDNQVTIIVAKAELGQGVSTALPMIVAEELEADWQNIKVELRAELEPFFLAGSGYTTSSNSIRTQFKPLRKVGAAAKEMLITACAQRWQVLPESLTAENSYISHPTKGSISYGELAEEANKLSIPENPVLKDPSEFKIIGKPLARLDMPDHVDGKTIFGTDIVVPDMLYAAVRQSPVFWGKVSNFDSLTLEGTNAEAILEIPAGVAVVAKSWWEADRLAQSLEIEFDNPEEMEDLSSEDISEILTQDLVKTGKMVNLVGDPVSAMEEASIQVNATYEVPFLAHAAMEPMTCTAKVTSTSCEIWVPTQAACFALDAAAETTGLDPSAIKVYPTYVGGSFGRKDMPDCVVHAILAAKAMGTPVKVIWSREEDIQHDYYRPAFKAEISGGIDDNNKIVSWIAKNAGPPLFGEWFHSITGFAMIPYDVSNMSVQTVESDFGVSTTETKDFGVPVANWRGVGYTQNIFFVESFVDELAHETGEDPLEFRKKHLNDSRGIELLEKVAEMANWGQARVSGASQGLAFSHAHGSILAQVVEVSVESGGKINVHKVYCAINCGDVVNPDIVKAQIEGGIIFGLTAALFGEITLDSGRVQQSNFHNHPILTLKDSPIVETEIIISGAKLGGIGEVGTQPIFPAVTNAIFASTGHRIRRLPVSSYELS